MARRAEPVLGAVGVVEVAVGRLDQVRVLAPALAGRADVELLVPGVRLERAREEHARPDLVLADVLRVGRDHRVEAEVLLHLDDRAHGIVDPPLEHVGHRLVLGLELPDQRQARASSGSAPGRASPARTRCGCALRSSSGSSSGDHRTGLIAARRRDTGRARARARASGRTFGRGRAARGARRPARSLRRAGGSRR